MSTLQLCACKCQSRAHRFSDGTIKATGALVMDGRIDDYAQPSFNRHEIIARLRPKLDFTVKTSDAAAQKALFNARIDAGFHQRHSVGLALAEQSRTQTLEIGT